MDKNHQDLKTGTTTVGIILSDDAVVLAADMKATMGHLNYDEESQKVYKITNYMAVTNAGSVGDSLTVIRFLKSQAKVYEMERECRMSVRAAATFLSNVLNSNRYYPFMVQLLIGGLNNKAELFELTPYGGMLERRQYGVSGSGSELALSVLDQNYKKGMSEDDGIKLAINAIKAAKRRDVYSGGRSITVMVIDREGVREIPNKEVEKLIAGPVAAKASA